MRRKRLLELGMIEITEKIREMAYEDNGEKKTEKTLWGEKTYIKYNNCGYLRAAVEDGILKLELYRREDIRMIDEEPVYRIFLSNTENAYATFHTKERKWRKAKIANLEINNYRPGTYYKNRIWISNEDSEVIKTYLGIQGANVFGIINDWQGATMHRKEIQKIDCIMCQITETPADLKEWITKDAFWNEQYLFYNAKEEKAYCTACKKIIQTKMKSLHNHQVTCPECGRKVIAKSWNKQKTIQDYQEVILLQKIPEGIIARKFRCKKLLKQKDSPLEFLKEWREQVRIYERTRALYNMKLWEIRAYQYDNFKQLGKLRWCNSSYVNAINSGVIYPGNIEKIRKGTKLEGIPLEMMLESEKGERIDIGRFFNADELIGYLIRAGLTRLTMDTITGTVRNIERKGKDAQEALGINKGRLNRLQKINGGRNALSWLQYEQETGNKIRQETLIRLEQADISRYHIAEILQYGVTPERALNYIEKQPQKRNEVLTEWKDYLRMAKDEGYDTTDDIVRMPRDLKTRHDELVEIEDKRKDEKRLKEYKRLDRQIRKRLQEAKRYFWENETYMIIPAAKCEELMVEGRTLHHCVGRNDYYMKKMAEGISWILFLRKKEDLKKPYYTVEIDMKEDRILQYYSEFNRQPDEQVIANVLDKFRKDVKKRKNRIRQSVIA